MSVMYYCYDCVAKTTRKPIYSIIRDLPPRPPARLGFYKDIDDNDEDKPQSIPPRPPARLGFYDDEDHPSPLKIRKKKKRTRRKAIPIPQETKKWLWDIAAFEY
ncbi:14531_t:CDS:2 [Ambispora leptoticha]|uniref:14531_t:CDS:1 n=1 Tax=Ambispora leptoticha TaxID=144679 RepID=A0A9N8VD52_9GLOM|nr:14531_t:CDS:2 [Ambispora leptoticha]